MSVFKCFVENSAMSSVKAAHKLVFAKYYAKVVFVLFYSVSLVVNYNISKIVHVNKYHT